MLKGIKEFISRSDVITVAGGLLMALAAFTLIQAVVGCLIAPLISVFVGDPISRSIHSRSMTANSGMAL